MEFIGGTERWKWVTGESSHETKNRASPCCSLTWNAQSWASQVRNLHNPGNKTQLSSPKKVTGASGSEEQALAKQIARAVHHHAVGRAFHLLVAFFPPRFQIAPISHGRGKTSTLSFIRQSCSLKFRARSIWKFLQQRTGTTPRIRISVVQYWNECHGGLFWVRPWDDWNSITSPALKGRAAQRTQS